MSLIFVPLSHSRVAIPCSWQDTSGVCNCTIKLFWDETEGKIIIFSASPPHPRHSDKYSLFFFANTGKIVLLIAIFYLSRAHTTSPVLTIFFPALSYAYTVCAAVCAFLFRLLSLIYRWHNATTCSRIRDILWKHSEHQFRCREVFRFCARNFVSWAAAAFRMLKLSKHSFLLDHNINTFSEVNVVARSTFEILTSDRSLRRLRRGCICAQPVRFVDFSPSRVCLRKSSTAIFNIARLLRALEATGEEKPLWKWTVLVIFTHSQQPFNAIQWIYITFS